MPTRREFFRVSFGGIPLFTFAWPPRWLAPEAVIHAPASVVTGTDTTIACDGSKMRVGDIIKIGYGDKNRARVVHVTDTAVSVIRGV